MYGFAPALCHDRNHLDSQDNSSRQTPKRYPMMPVNHEKIAVIGNHFTPMKKAECFSYEITLLLMRFIGRLC
jgi:hypothetical protein